MIRLIAVAFALTFATSAQAMSPAPLHQPDGMTTRVPPFGVAPLGHELMASAWPEPPSGRPADNTAGVRDGVEALAFSTTETPADRVL